MSIAVQRDKVLKAQTCIRNLETSQTYTLQTTGLNSKKEAIVLNISYLIRTADKSKQERILKQLDRAGEVLKAPSFFPQFEVHPHDSYLQASTGYLNNEQLPQLNDEDDDDTMLEYILEAFKQVGETEKVTISIHVKWFTEDSWDDYFHFGPDATLAELLQNYQLIKESLQNLENLLEQKPSQLNNIQAQLISALNEIKILNSYTNLIPNVTRID
jgi:hypothetical protein